MKIVHIAAEFAPIAKAGGLGEAVFGLCNELAEQHHQVEIILPKYSHIHSAALNNFSPTASFITSQRGKEISNTIWTAKMGGCTVHLLEAHHPHQYFQRNQIYGFDDDVVRFLYFSKAAMDFLSTKEEMIDILHLHDWHTAICAALRREESRYTSRSKACVFTIHNLSYQGKCAPWDLDAIGMNGKAYLIEDKMQDPDPQFPETINLLQGGILLSNATTTVSPTYAKEILQQKLGCKMSGALKKTNLIGILNGIDPTSWNPENDPNLAAHFHPGDSLKKIQAAKYSNKMHFGKKYCVDCTTKPLIGAITRLVEQKGIKLLQASIDLILANGGSFALLGSASAPEIQAEFDELKRYYKNDARVYLEFEYDDNLAHLLYAALDFILVPSLFEPCGLTQLIAMRYATIPIVRATGGLKDTVFDCENGKIALNKRNGFTFEEPTVEALHAVLQRALHFWRSDPASYLSMMRRAMLIDSSWKNPAKEYIKLYQTITNSKKTARPQRRLARKKQPA